MSYVFEIVFAVIITLIFIKKEKPNVLFLFLGYLFFFVALLLQFPFKYLQVYLTDYIQGEIITGIAFIFFSVLVVEIAKFFALKKFLKTRSVKNGILFGIGWSSIESINYFKDVFLSWFFGILNVNVDYSFLLNPEYTFLNFVLFFAVNIAITVFVIKAIVKKKIIYLILAIFYGFAFGVGYALLSDIQKDIFSLFFFIYSLRILFRYNKLKDN